MPLQPHSPSGMSTGTAQVALAGLASISVWRKVKFGVQVPVPIGMGSTSSGLPSTRSQAGVVFVWRLKMSPDTGAGSVLFPLLPLTEESAGMTLAGNSHHHCHRVSPQPLPAVWQEHFCSEIEVPASGSLLKRSHSCTVTISKQRIKLI